MPKGGDLHNHLGGAIYAESLIDFSADSGWCVDRTTSFLVTPPCDASCDRYNSKPRVACAYQDHVLYNRSSTPGPCATGTAGRSLATTTFLPPSTSFRGPC
jgi:hypothetical protein